jgi:hypothetical protein
VCFGFGGFVKPPARYASAAQVVAEWDRENETALQAAQQFEMHPTAASAAGSYWLLRL